jgi:hypothetical protein
VETENHQVVQRTLGLLARGQDLVVSTNHAFAIQPIIFQIIF